MCSEAAEELGGKVWVVKAQIPPAPCKAAA